MGGWRDDDMLPHMLSVFAWLAWLQGRVADAFRLDGAARAQVVSKGLSNAPVFDRASTHLERAAMGGASSAGDVSRWRLEGEQLSEDEVGGALRGRMNVESHKPPSSWRPFRARPWRADPSARSVRPPASAGDQCARGGAPSTRVQ